MPLTKVGAPIPSIHHVGEFAEAESNEGGEVIVSASYEAIEEYGWSTIWNTASDKHDRYGGLSVHVTTDDCLS